MRKALLCLVLCLSSCSWFSAKATASEKAFVSCAKADVTANAASIAGSVLEEVTKILVSGTAGYQTDLDALGGKVGADVLACAVETVKEVFLTQASVASGSAMSTSEPNPVAGRAADYLASHGIQFAPAGQ